MAEVPGVPCWNPVLFADGERLLLFYKVGEEIPRWQTFIKESPDSGLTWSEGRELVPGDFGGRGPVKNKCIRLQDGALLAPASTEGAGWACFTDRSEDGGRTWHRSPDVPFERGMLSGSGTIQPTLWQDERGTVHMLMRSSEGAIYRSRSEDGGRSWGTTHGARPARGPWRIWSGLSGLILRSWSGGADGFLRAFMAF